MWEPFPTILETPFSYPKPHQPRFLLLTSSRLRNFFPVCGSPPHLCVHQRANAPTSNPRACKPHFQILLVEAGSRSRRPRPLWGVCALHAPVFSADMGQFLPQGGREGERESLWTKCSCLLVAPCSSRPSSAKTLPTFADELITGDSGRCGCSVEGLPRRAM
jgi:hypothetical protein